MILVNFLFSRISKDKLNSEISNDVNSGKNQLTLNQSSGNVINQTNNISNQNNALTEQTIEVTQKSGNPTPEEIGVNLSKHKPFDKEKIKENYKNIKVSWVLKISFIIYNQ